LSPGNRDGIEPVAKENIAGKGLLETANGSKADNNLEGEIMKNFLFSIAIFCGMTSLVSAQWTQQESGVTSNLFGIRFTSATKGWVVGQNGTFMSTTDGGGTWTAVAGQWGSNLNKIFFADSTHGWIVGDYNVILETTDGGTSWQSDNDLTGYMADYYGICSPDSGRQNHVWISGGRSYTSLSVVGKSVGNGTWSPQIMGFAGRLVRIFFLNDTLGWAVGDSGLVLSTKNGGTWWNQLPSGTYTGLNDIAFYDSLDGICVGDNGLIMNTTDGGSRWRVIESTPGTIFFKLLIQGDSVAYAAGGPNGVILKSTDRGSTWVPQTVTAPAETVFEDIYFVSDTEGWAAGNGGVIVHTVDGGVTSLTAPQRGAYDFNLRQNYPNPFNPSTVISYTLPQDSFVTIKIYDELGQEVRTLVSEEESAGDHAATFDAREFASGVYFYRLTAGETTMVRKLLLLK
jgi:photosystem II stability/assembly factor-like uncharacterized protein